MNNYDKTMAINSQMCQSFEYRCNKDGLIKLGFVRFPEWDFIDIADHYRLQIDRAVFRAFVCEHNHPIYVQVGLVVGENGIVRRWKDCVSNGSVQRFINQELARKEVLFS